MSLLLLSSMTPSSMQSWVSSLQCSGISTLSYLDGVDDADEIDPSQSMDDIGGEKGGEKGGDKECLELLMDAKVGLSTTLSNSMAG